MRVDVNLSNLRVSLQIEGRHQCPRHLDCRRLLVLLQEQAARIVVPALLLPEMAVAIGQGRQDAGLAVSSPLL